MSQYLQGTVDLWGWMSRLLRGDNRQTGTLGAIWLTNLFQLAVDMLHNQVNGYCIPAPWRGKKRITQKLLALLPHWLEDKADKLTSGHHNICQAHGGLDILIKGRLDKLVVLLNDTLNVPASLTDVPA